MTNRELTYIVKNQQPLLMQADATVREACRQMRERASGSTLVVDSGQRLIGIFTGRDAVRLLAKGNDAGAVLLVKAMTRNPVTTAPTSRAIDALRAMGEGGFRHVPVTEDGMIRGVVSRGDLKGMELEEFRWEESGTPRSGTSGFRSLAEVAKSRRPFVVGEDDTVQQACKGMRRRSCGCALVADRERGLVGIFTGRDAVRILATAEEAGAACMSQAMTRKPMTLDPNGSAIDALRLMNDGGFRHVPIVHKQKIAGVVSQSDFTGIEIDRLDEEEHLKEVLW
jgi:CBS domain-containing protein